MPALRFIRGIEGFGHPSEEEASNQAVLDAFPSEVPASTENQTGPLIRPTQRAGRQHEAITFPVTSRPITQLSEDEDVDLPQHSVPNTLPKKARIRFGLFPGLLLLLVLLQGVPSFLWLRQRFTASTPSRAATEQLKLRQRCRCPLRYPRRAALHQRRPTTGASPSVVAPPGPTGCIATRGGRAASSEGIRFGCLRTNDGRAFSRAPIGNDARFDADLRKGEAGGNHRCRNECCRSATMISNSSAKRLATARRGRVTVKAARTTKVRLNPPSGLLSVNASPWAEVWVDNQRIGETPLGNIRMPIGQAGGDISSPAVW